MTKTIRRLLENIKIEPAYDPAIPLVATYLKDSKSLSQKNIYIPMFTAALFTIAKSGLQPKCPLTG